MVFLLPNHLVFTGAAVGGMYPALIETHTITECSLVQTLKHLNGELRLIKTELQTANVSLCHLDGSLLFQIQLYRPH